MVVCESSLVYCTGPVVENLAALYLGSCWVASGCLDRLSVEGARMEVGKALCGVDVRRYLLGRNGTRARFGPVDVGDHPVESE